MEDIKKTVDLAEEVTKETNSSDNGQPDATDEAKENKPFEFDYEKLASIVQGKQSTAEDSVLKGYFKQQGLSAEEMEQAIASFKTQKAEATPDINAIQSEAEASLSRALNAETQKEAMLMASELGVDIKAIPYLVRMANVEDVTANGEVDKAKLKASLEEVISAMPQLKQTAVQGGFQVVGADTTQNAQSSDDKEIERAFGIK